MPQQVVLCGDTEHPACLELVAFGDSSPEGAHCGNCQTFADLWPAGIQAETGRSLNVKDLNGSREPGLNGGGETSASLGASLRSNKTTRAAARNADIILVATGPNEMQQAFDPLMAGTCGGADGQACLRAVSALWSANFEAILTEIETLRAGKQTAVRLVNAANPFLSEPDLMKGLPAGFATGDGARIFDALSLAMRLAAAAHHAVFVDVRPIQNGAALDRRVDKNSSASMRSVTKALLATGLPELGERVRAIR